MEKAVHNIISNAIRHSPAGAELGLELSFDSLLVRNSGVNIPDEDLDKLFTPFYCVEKSHNKLTGGSVGTISCKNYLGTAWSVIYD